MTGRLRALWALVLQNSLLLLGGTLTGLIWANAAHPSYERFAHTLHFVVNSMPLPAQEFSFLSVPAGLRSGCQSSPAGSGLATGS